MKLTEIRKSYNGTLYVDGFRIFYKPTEKEYADDYFCYDPEVELYELCNSFWAISDLDTKDMITGNCALIQELICEIAEYTEYDEPYVEENIEFLLVDENIYIIKFEDSFISYDTNYQSWTLVESIIDVVSVYGESLKDALF